MTKIRGIVSLVALCLAATVVIPACFAQLAAGAPAAESIASHGYSAGRVMFPGSKYSGERVFVLTRDEIYVPILIRKPDGLGPFPAITIASGEGREGMKKVETLAERLAPMQDRMIERGYAVVTINYRNEIPYAYESAKPPVNLKDSISGESRMLKSGPTLDHEDLIAIIRYLQTRPDSDGIGSMGVSHSGEMIIKAASEFSWGAGICIEPANHEFLTVNTGPTAPRKGSEIQYNDVEVARANANKTEAMERIARIQMPILIFGRTTDHQNGIFKLSYQWMKEAGKNVEWQEFDHPVHGYVFIYPQKDGSYKPDAMQAKAFDVVMNYFDEHLKKMPARNSAAGK